MDGLAVQLSKPTALLFITAILPPFLDPDRPLVAQVAIFGALGMALDMTAMTAYGLGGSAMAEKMAQPSFRQIFDVAVGLLLIGVAALIVLRG